VEPTFFIHYTRHASWGPRWHLILEYLHSRSSSGRLLHTAGV
jgi:hypothetical protein